MTGHQRFRLVQGVLAGLFLLGCVAELPGTSRKGGAGKESSFSKRTATAGEAPEEVPPTPGTAATPARPPEPGEPAAAPDEGKPATPAVNADRSVKVADESAIDVSAIVNYSLARTVDAIEWAPEKPELRWRVATKAEIKLSKIRITYTADSGLAAPYRLRQAEDEETSGDAEPPPDDSSPPPEILNSTPPESPSPGVFEFASDDPQATPWPSPFIPTPEPVPGAAAVASDRRQGDFEVAPADLGWPEKLAAKAEVPLVLNLDNEQTRSFIRDKLPIDRVELVINLLDEGGAVVPEGDRPAVLRGYFIIK